MDTLPFKGVDDVRNGLVNLVKLLRKSLELTEKLSIPLREELDFVQTYVNLEQERVGEGFTLTLSVDEDFSFQRP